MTKSSIDWDKFKQSLPKSIQNAHFLLETAKADLQIKNEILNHKSVIAYKAFKKFRREVDSAPITDDQKIAMIRGFKVIDHL